MVRKILVIDRIFPQIKCSPRAGGFNSYSSNTRNQISSAYRAIYLQLKLKTIRTASAKIYISLELNFEFLLPYLRLIYRITSDTRKKLSYVKLFSLFYIKYKYKYYKKNNQ